MTVVCEHPTDAVRWDEHRAFLFCTACGRKLEDQDAGVVVEELDQ